MCVVQPAMTVLQACVGVAALFAATALQGCGGGQSSYTTTRVRTTATSITSFTSTTQTTTTTLIPPPVPRENMSQLLPLRAISYKAYPVKTQTPPQLPSEDMMQIGYKMQWGPDGRDDLGQMKLLGANAVRLYNSIGLEYITDHGAFLDRAEEIGMHVIVGIHSQNVCPDFDCYKTWKDSVKNSSSVGFVKNGSWHPAIAMFVLLDAPDQLNFWQAQGVPTNCTSSPLKGNEAQCRVKASLSAMEGFLAAEKELGIDSTVNLTISWTFDIKDSIDGVVKAGEGYYGFQDMMVGVKNPSLAKYSPKAGKSGQQMLSTAFTNRWVHSVSSGSSWDYVKGKIQAKYDPYTSTPWFIAEFTASDPSSSIGGDLQAMDSEASSEGPFIGVSFADYQHNYITDTAQGIFALGEHSLGSCISCQEDVFAKEKLCRTFEVKCLNAMGGDNRADEVVAAWGGSWKGHGMCLTKDSTASSMVIVV